MRVLFVAHRVPYPPNKGDKIRAYHLMRGLVEAGHQVRLLAFADDRRDLNHGSALRALGVEPTILPLERRRATARALLALTGPAPLSLAYFARAPMRRLISGVIATGPVDALLICSSAMAQYAPTGLLGRTVVDFVDADSQKWADLSRLAAGPRSWLYRIEATRLRRYERALIGQVARTVVCHQREAEALDSGGSTRSIEVIENGVEPGPPPLSHQLGTNPPRLVFVGAMDYAPNVDGVCWFIERTLPLIRKQRPDTELVVVGRDPAPAIRRLARYPGVVVTGTVADPRPYLDSAAVCVVPLRVARGVQNKLLEALAAGRATVATSVAVAGTSAVAGEHLLVANTPPELATAILRLLGDETLRAALGAQARQLVEREYRWAPRQAQLVELLESVAAPRSGTGR